MSTRIDKKIAVRVTNTTESLNLMNKKAQIAELSVVSPNQSRFTKPVDMAFLSMIPEGDTDQNTYLKELLRTNKPEQQNNTFWLQAPEKPGKTGDHTSIRANPSQN